MPYEPHAVMEEDLFEEARNVMRTSGGIRVGIRMMMMIIHALMIIPQRFSMTPVRSLLEHSAQVEKLGHSILAHFLQ